MFYLQPTDNEVGQYTECDNASRRWLYRLKPLSRVSDRSLLGTTWCQPQSVRRGGTETAEPAAMTESVSVCVSVCVCVCVCEYVCVRPCVRVSVCARARVRVRMHLLYSYA